MSSHYVYYLNMPASTELQEAWKEYLNKLYAIDHEEHKLIEPTLTLMRQKREQAWKEFLKKKKKILEG